MSRPTGGKKFFEAQGQRTWSLGLYLSPKRRLPQWARNAYAYGYADQEPWKHRFERNDHPTSETL